MQELAKREFFWCILKSKTQGLRRTPKATQALLSTGPSTVIASVRAVREKCFRATDVEPSIHACVLVQNFSGEWNANQFAGKFLGCKTQSKWSWKDQFFFLNCTQPPITSHFLFSLVSGDADFSAYFFSCQLDRKFGRFNPQVPLLQPPFDLIKSQFFWVEPLPKISQNDFRFET